MPGNVRIYLAGLICSVFVAASTSAFALLTRSMVNRIFVDQNVTASWFVAAAVIAVAIIKGLSTYFGVVFNGMLRRDVVTNYQKLQFRKLTSQSLVFLSSKHPSKQIAQVVLQAKAAADAFLTVTTTIVRDILTLVGLVCVMVFQEPLMSMFAALALPLIIISLSSITRKVREFSKSENELAGQVYSLGSEALEGIRTVKSYQLEDKTRTTFSKAVESMQERAFKLERLAAFASPVMETLGGIIVGCFIVYASWQSLTNGKTPGEFMAFIMAFLFAYEPAKRLASVNVSLQRKLIQIGRMYDLLDKKETEAADTDNVVVLDEIKGELEFSNVKFGYRKNQPFLHGVSFKVSPGETIAIVGRSGSGKTTIINLILRLVSPNAGQIKLDGVDLNRIGFKQLRQAVSLVSQDVFLFENSIRENIRDGKPDATDDEIREAVRLANVEEFTKDLPDGLDTHIGPNATNLSGGQRQRIAIARAILKVSPVIIFDEATSALDGESERMIINSQIKLSENRTLIVVAHRLSTIQAADRIILLDDGYVIANGTHEELEKSSDLYRSLFHLGETYGKQKKRLMADGAQ